ncbi:MAG: hypothetical protein K5756_00290 [Clostridiales bacterium]|nr:hypothetical protein [Clostridiales bacterium]
MKKYVSPELNVELFNLADMIMLSNPDFNGGVGGGTEGGGQGGGAGGYNEDELFGGNP